MAIGFPAGITAVYVVSNAQQKLAALRNALADCEDFYRWMTAYAAADFTQAPVGMDTGSADALFAAFADADALYQLYAAGLPPGSYPQPASRYVYGASQRVIIGPL